MSTPAQIVKIAGGTFEPSAHRYKNESGVVVPSVTQILDSVGLVNYDNVPGDTLEHKSQIGDAVHFACHLLDTCPTCQGILDNKDFCKKCGKVFEEGSLDWETVHVECVPYVMAYQNFKTAGDFVAEGSEESGIFALSGMPFAYTRDRHGRMRGIDCRITLELKCAYAEEKSWKWQLAAYRATVPRLQPNEFIGSVACQLKKDTTFRLFPYENPRDLDTFKSALFLTHTKINEGLPWQKTK